MYVVRLIKVTKYIVIFWAGTSSNDVQQIDISKLQSKLYLNKAEEGVWGYTKLEQ